MKFLDAVPALFVLALRLPFVPPSRWALDWISVLALIWIAVVRTPEESPARRWSVAAGCLWLAAIYSAHQGAWTFAGFQ